MNIVTAMVPSQASVVAALRLLGTLNAGTPLLMASTPVSAAQPELKARSSRKPQASPPRPFDANGSCGRISRPALSTMGSSPNVSRAKPMIDIPRIATMNR